MEGGTIEQNAKKTLGILRNENKSCARDICLLNSAAAIISAGLADDFKAAFELAKESLESGKALDKLETLIKFSNQ